MLQLLLLICGKFDRVQRNDVFDDGAGGRSVGAACDVWSAEHVAVLSVGRDLIRLLHFRKWLRAIAIVDPFTYAIHGFKAILLKDGGLVAIRGDLLFLFAFGIGTLLIATPLFKRTL